MTHELKIMKRWFEDVQSGKKNFEIRRSDRDFKVGDLLLLQEYDHGKYTGREITREVEYIYKGDGTYGVSDMFWILGLKQEPCEDAVSREAVLDIVKNNYRMAAIDLIEKLPPVIPKPTECENAVDRDAIIKEMETRHKNGDAITLGYIKNLPPVTPKLRTGKWIYTGDYITDGMLKCSSCGYEHDVADRFMYCPNCGAKMEG